MFCVNASCKPVSCTLHSTALLCQHTPSPFVAHSRLYVDDTLWHCRLLPGAVVDWGRLPTGRISMTSIASWIYNVKINTLLPDMCCKCKTSILTYRLTFYIAMLFIIGTGIHNGVNSVFNFWCWFIWNNICIDFLYTIVIIFSLRFDHLLQQT